MFTMANDLHEIAMIKNIYVHTTFTLNTFDINVWHIVIRVCDNNSIIMLIYMPIAVDTKIVILTILLIKTLTTTVNTYTTPLMNK